jgi:hypothetical protein
MTDTATVTKLPARPEPVAEDKIHGLLNDSIEKIAQGWIDQLIEVRKNTEVLETQMLACVMQTKANIERLHDLGEQIAREAARGREVCAKLSEGVAQITGS